MVNTGWSRLQPEGGMVCTGGRSPPFTLFCLIILRLSYVNAIPSPLQMSICSSEPSSSTGKA